MREKNAHNSSILLIYTGGTIGMKEDAKDGTLRPFNFDALMEEVPELSKFAGKIDSYTFSPLIDSSDVEPGMWQRIAELIRDKYEQYDGFVILHGTDTMAYSASALSFMLDNLDKAVIFTGSQLPVGRPRTDGKENLISSIEIASAKKSDGRAMVPEVCIFFNSQLFRGNRCTKADAEGFDAFRSPNYPALANAGINIKYNTQLIHYPASHWGTLSINTQLDTSVNILKLHPGMTPQIARYILCDRNTRATIIETYGSGNAISSSWFVEIVREATQMGRIVLNVTQCQVGEVNMDLYATGRALKEAGVVSGYDSTTEAALAKLFYLLGTNEDNSRVKALLERNLKGEISN